VIWNTEDIVRKGGGETRRARTGHAFLKAEMRASGAVYGGEMSAHHYFRDFMSCDSGMIPWLLVLQLMGRTGRSLHDLLAERRRLFPSSGEINFTVDQPEEVLQRVIEIYKDQAEIDTLDGYSFDLGTWRFNLRRSNTEPLVRLNVEAKEDADLVAKGVAEVSGLLRSS